MSYWTSTGLIVAVLMTAFRATASEITLFVVDPTGHPKSGCQVTHFRAWNEDWAKGKEYRNHFRRLVGQNIPFGHYEVMVECGNEQESLKDVEVKQGKQFEVLALAPGKLIFDGVNVQLPTLDVILVPLPRQNERWWIRLTGLYNEKTYIDQFGSQHGDAHLTDPDPGMYVAMVYSSRGYACVREVEFTNFSHHWSFRPEGCAFEFDEFAHLIERDENYRKKYGAWDEHIRQWEDNRRRASDAAAIKTKKEIDEILYCKDAAAQNKLPESSKKHCVKVLQDLTK